MAKAPSHPIAPSIIKNHAESNGCMCKFFALILTHIIIILVNAILILTSIIRVIANIYLVISVPFIWLGRTMLGVWISKKISRLIYGQQRENQQQPNWLPKN